MNFAMFIEVGKEKNFLYYLGDYPHISPRERVKIKDLRAAQALCNGTKYSSAKSIINFSLITSSLASTKENDSFDSWGCH